MGSSNSTDGFTLIEMSIVLVIIGLIVGGVLVGQDLIRASAVRSQITQIEKYQTAANTFRGKYGGLPGDINAAAATQFGFVTRGQYQGEGDGNGVIEGVVSNAPASNSGVYECAGETTVFWVDLSRANLIEANFSKAQPTSCFGLYSTEALLRTVFPASKIGQGGVFNSVYVYSNNGNNYYGLSDIISVWSGPFAYGRPSLSPAQAFNIDQKSDDGLPQSGKITAQYLNANISVAAPVWSIGGQPACCSGTNGPTDASSTPRSAISCYDNGGVNGGMQQYSIQNSAVQNCALSFQFQ